MNKSRPNIFSWATSELSQDAFICWLLSWVNHKDDTERALSETSRYFLSKLTDNRVSDFHQIEIKKQYKNIDIFVKINDEFALLIEDKTHTKNHSGQLERYRQELLEEKYDESKIIPVYLKTGDQGNYQSIVKEGYKPFLRKDFLDVLEFGIKAGVKNNILLDFYYHLKSIEQHVQSYRTLPVSDWYWGSWKGFFSELVNRLGEGDWDYVPQKNGGFWGFWWCFQYKEHNGDKFECYLQLEEKKFCFKLYPYEREKAQTIRYHYRSLLYKKANEHNIAIEQNGRVGKYMTVAKLKETYLKTDDNGMIDFERTVELINRIEKMLREV